MDPFLTITSKSTGWPTPWLFNESMLSNLQPDHDLGNRFKTYATPLLLPRELVDKELLMPEVGCYDARSDKAVIRTMIIIRTATITVTAREKFVQILREIIY